MAVDQTRVDRTSAMGASITTDGTGFRTWAPNASSVAVVAGARLTATQLPAWQPKEQDLLAPLGDGSWGGFLSGVGDGDPYMFFVTGTGSSGCSGEPMDGFSASASLTLPANGVIALVRV